MNLPMHRTLLVFVALASVHLAATVLILEFGEYFLPPGWGDTLAMVVAFILPMVVVLPFAKLGLPVYASGVPFGWLSPLGMALPAASWLLIWLLVAVVVTRARLRRHLGVTGSI